MSQGPSQETDVTRSSKQAHSPLPDRIDRARREGRTQQALELTRQLFKHSPSPEHEELLRQVTLERGMQLQLQGHTRDAAVVYGNALDLGGHAEFRASIAERLAVCGDIPRALRALGSEPEPRQRQQILGHLADHAVRQGSSGKNTLPPDLHAGFDAVLQAFAHSEAGREEQARAVLQAIGLTSPFLEWKLLLRGLFAYYARDDARAVENWQRLDPQRLPARLAAPLRLGIDTAFRRAQPAATQNALQQQAAKLAGPAPASALSGLRKALANPRSLAAAFREAERLLPELQRDRPKMVPRLAHCFFWAIVQHGQPEDVDRFRRTFGPLATDVDVARLEALALQHRDAPVKAHMAWQDVLRALARGPREWPGEVGKRAQAMVWMRMALNAAQQECQPRNDELSFFDYYREKPPPLKPSAEDCFEHCLELAPDHLEAYLALFRLHREKGQVVRARKVGNELLKRFPDHAATAEALGDLFLETQQPRQAREAFEKALAANPLEQRLRGKLARARQNFGLDLTVEGEYDSARAEYQAALALTDGPHAPLLCQCAVLEMKAGQPDRAAELIARAAAGPGQRVAVRYGLVGESVRARLSPADKKRLAAELAEALAQPPTPAEVLALLELAADQRQRQLDAFRGQKTHERNFVRFLDRIPLDEFSEPELEKLCRYLQILDARRPWERCLNQAEFEYPDNLVLRLSRVDFFLTRKEPQREVWNLRACLDAIRKIVHKLPREAQERFLPALREREKEVQALGGPPMHPFDMLEPFFEDDDDDDDECDEDEWW
jgi:tetratricopeptide (TPR) repeat protein